MPDKFQTVFHWSSGKDSALALYYLLQDQSYIVSQLLTTVNEHFDRVTMHGTPVSLLEKQVASLNIDHSIIKLPESATMEVYESQMKNTMIPLSNGGFTHAAFGDIFLEDLKKYREREMKSFGFETVFPLWKKNTTELIFEFIELGFKSVVVSANDQLGKQFLGRTIDRSFVEELPENIDPCGENGEFHTFCYDGPIFAKPIKFNLGDKIKRSYPNPVGEGSIDFWFIDLVE